MPEQYLPAVRVPTSDEFGCMKMMAEEFAKNCALIPKALYDQPTDALLCILQGHAVGISAAQALQSIYVVNGKATVYGDMFMALIRRHPACVDVVEEFQGVFPDDTYVAVCTMMRLSHGEVRKTTRRFSIGDAKRALLWKKQGPWTLYPKRMLQMRARSWCGRDVFPDALQGLIAVEEALDIPPPKHIAAEVVAATEREVEQHIQGELGPPEEPAEAPNAETRELDEEIEKQFGGDEPEGGRPASFEERRTAVCARFRELGYKKFDMGKLAREEELQADARIWTMTDINAWEKVADREEKAEDERSGAAKQD